MTKDELKFHNEVLGKVTLSLAEQLKESEAALDEMKGARDYFRDQEEDVRKRLEQAQDDRDFWIKQCANSQTISCIASGEQERLAQALAESKALVLSHEEHIEKLETQVKNLQRLVFDRDEDIDELTDEVHLLRSKGYYKEEKLKAFLSKIEELTNAIL